MWFWSGWLLSVSSLLVEGLQTSRGACLGPGSWAKCRLVSGSSRTTPRFLFKLWLCSLFVGYQFLVVGCFKHNNEFHIHLCLKWERRHSMARFFGLVERAPRFMTQGQADAIHDEGMAYIQRHLELAKISFQQLETTWAIKPKLHTFEHQLVETKRTSTYPEIYQADFRSVWVVELRT